MRITNRRIKKSSQSESETPAVIAQGPDLEDVLGGGPAVSIESNRIYFYADIDRSSILQLNKALYTTSLMLKTKAMELSTEPANIYLHINSDGGEVEQGLIASDYIRKCKVPVYTIVDGSCSSAATFMSIVGTKRYIHENSFMLIHQLSGNMWGTFSNMQDEMANCRLLMEVAKGLYKKYTKLSNKMIEEILKKDLMLHSKECLRYGLVDEII